MSNKFLFFVLDKVEESNDDMKEVKEFVKNKNDDKTNSKGIY
jgi:hypothetical protein